MRARLADLSVGAVAAIGGGAAVALAGHGPLQVVYGVLLGGSLALVRRHSVLAWSLAGVVLLLDHPPDNLPFAAALLIACHAFGAGRWGSSRTSVAGLIVLVATAELALGHLVDSAVPVLLMLVPTWIGGRVLREVVDVAGQLAARERELDDERADYARLSVRYERARIAAELHDIVAHAITVIVVQASAGQRVAPERTAQTFDTIAAAARTAEQDMGRLVALLGDPEAMGPAPDLRIVEELVDRAAGSGLSVTLRLEGDREGLPAPVVQAAVRVVQESLTNALRYASGAPIRIVLRGSPRALEIEVDNDPSGEESLASIGTGNGLRGLRERVAACGGTLDARPTSDGGWRVTASLPRRAVAAVG